jgi:hypothetical protein
MKNCACLRSTVLCEATGPLFYLTTNVCHLPPLRAAGVDGLLNMILNRINESAGSDNK